MSKRLLVRIYLIVELVLFVGLTITSLTDTPIPSGIFVSLALASMVALAIMVKTDNRVDKILHIASSSIFFVGSLLDVLSIMTGIIPSILYMVGFLCLLVKFLFRTLDNKKILIVIISILLCLPISLLFVFKLFLTNYLIPVLMVSILLTSIILGISLYIRKDKNPEYFFYFIGVIFYLVHFMAFSLMNEGLNVTVQINDMLNLAYITFIIPSFMMIGASFISFQRLSS